MTRGMWIALLSTLWALSTLGSEEQCIDIDLRLAGRLKRIYAATSRIRLVGNFSASLSMSRLVLTFSTNLTRGVDYEIEPFVQYQLPAPYQRDLRHRHERSLLLVLIKGRQWIASSERKEDGVLVLERVQYCLDREEDAGLALLRHPMEPIQIATVDRSNQFRCPAPLQLPRVTEGFRKYIDDIFEYCQRPMVVPVGQLVSDKTSSLSLLSLHPPVLFIDARKSKLIKAARIVDRYLSAHSVLDVVWEPVNATEPQWWILMPKPRGMPGHLFALLDVLQWRHPLVASASTKYAAINDCTKLYACTPGCPKSKVVIVWGSGYIAYLPTTTI